MGGGGSSAPAPQTPPFEPSADFPTYISPDRFALSDSAALADKRYYRASDLDFKKRHRGLFKAEKLFENSVLQDQKGEGELSPALQAEFTRSGLINSASALGDSGSVLTPGGAGEASLARNLGVSIMGFQDRNRQNRQGSLAIAESLFPRRTFGLSGADMTNMELAKFNADQSRDELNWRNDANNTAAGIGQENANAQAEAEKKKALIQGGVALVGTIALGVAF